MKSRNPEVSIIIACMKNSKHLERIKQQLKNQTYKNFETIVIDNDDPVAKKRNDGFKKARGEWIIFIDDDITIPSNWLKEFMDNRMKNAIIGGPQSRFEFGESHIVSTCNVLVHRDVMKKINFDENFKRAAHEDLDWCIQAKKKGIKVINISNACVYHMGGGGTRLNRLKKEFYFGSERLKVERKWGNVIYPWKKQLTNKLYIIIGNIFHIIGIFYGLLKYKILRR